MGSIEKAKCWKKAQGAGVGEGKRERREGLRRGKDYLWDDEGIGEVFIF